MRVLGLRQMAPRRAHDADLVAVIFNQEQLRDVVVALYDAIRQYTSCKQLYKRLSTHDLSL